MFCKVIKLSNGETIIGSITKEERNYILVERPIRSHIVPISEGTYRVMLVRWDPTIDFSLPVKVFKENIISVGDPTKEFLDSYLEVYNNYEKYLLQEDAEEEDEYEEKEGEVDNEKIEAIMKLLSGPGANTTIH
jgi:hypothetical protein